MDLNTFIHTIRNMPHIIETIVQHLDTPDIVMCLRSSKCLRSFASHAVNHASPGLRSRLCQDARKRACMNGHWRTHETTFALQHHLNDLECSLRRTGYPPPPREFATKDQPLRRRLFWCLGLNDWICVSGQREGLTMYNPDTVWEAPVQVDRWENPRPEVVSGNCILLTKHETVQSLTLPDEEGLFWLETISEYDDEHHDHYRNCPAAVFLESNCRDVPHRLVFGLDPLGNSTVEAVCFYDREGWPDEANAVVLEADDTPIKMAKQGKFALLAWPSKIRIYDTTDGTKMWESSTENKLTEKLPMFVTDEMCGFMFQISTKRPFSLAGISKSKERLMEYWLKIFDTKTGESIGEFLCWRSTVRLENRLCAWGRPSQPHVLARGRYVCAVTNASQEDDDPDKVGCTIACAKAVKRDQSVKTRFELKPGHVRLHELIPALRRDAPLPTPSDLSVCAEDTVNDTVDPKLIGLAFDGAVAIGVHECLTQLQSDSTDLVATVFALDLDKVVKGEPIEKSVFFPMRSKIPKGGSVAFWPHYKTSSAGDEDLYFAGLVEITEDTKEKQLKSHLFRETVDIHTTPDF